MEISHKSTDDAATVERSNKTTLINLVLRTLTTVCLLPALVIIVTTNHTFDLSESLGINDYGDAIFKVRFHDILAYRFMLSASAIGILYTLIQIAISICGNRNNQKGMLLFNFYGDKVLSYLLMAGAGAGFGASIDMKRAFGQLDTFYDKGNASAGLLLGGFLFSAGSSIISSYALQNLRT